MYLITGSVLFCKFPGRAALANIPRGQESKEFFNIVAGTLNVAIPSPKELFYLQFCEFVFLKEISDRIPPFQKPISPFGDKTKDCLTWCP
jgi:hypothetical protein